MILLFDIGNSNTHLGLADARAVVKQRNIPTANWLTGNAAKAVTAFVGRAHVEGAAVCSVVPKATPHARKFVRRQFHLDCFELNHQTVTGVGVDYPRPQTIGPDRLANALAAKTLYGAPAVVIDFGTAVTFDVVDRNGNYIGGIIAPGLAALTDYLHEKTALLPRIKIRDIKTAVGKSTEEAMLIGAVHGYRGLIRELLTQLKRRLKTRRLAVVGTGGYAELIAARLPEIAVVEPLLTLEGLRLAWEKRARL